MVDVGILKKMPFFSIFDDKELALIGQRVIIEDYEPQREIFREHQIGDESMFIVVTGALKITKKQKSEEKVLANIKDGEFFGEMAMLVPAPRSASAVTIKPTKLVRMNDNDYNSFKREMPSIVVKLNEVFIKVLVKRLRDADVKLVKEGLGYGEI